MKVSINKSAKRVLSIALALAMLIGSLFTANVGVQIIADAATTDATSTAIAEGTIDLLEFGSYLTAMGSTSTYYDTNVADNGETGASWDDPIIIDSAEEFVYIAKTATNDTDGKYYKVADGIAGFNLSTDALDLDGTLADNLAIIQGSGKNHSGGTPGFQGHFDGNGVTIYGAWCSNTSVGEYAGLFSCAQGDVTIKNVNVKLSSFTAKTAAGGIVGYYKGEGNFTTKTTLTIENCSVTDTHFEVTGTGCDTGIGAIVGRVDCPSGYTETTDENNNGTVGDYLYVNNEINVNNCYVNLDEDYFTSAREDSSAVDQVCHGGVVARAGTNAVMVTNCIVIGVTPYATTEYTGNNDIQHTGHADNFSNVYTDQEVSASTYVGGTTNNGYQDLTSVMTQLTADQMTGAAAVANMNLDWFSTWIPAADGEYPTLNQTGAEADTSFWSGSAASGFASGSGTKEDPYIIKTADQLYLALTQITDTTNSVAGGVQTSQILKQDSTTEYVPVYTPNYYKVADGVKYFYLNNIYGSETLDGAKAMAATSTKKTWNPGKSFVGHLDGNGVTIYGMYNSGNTGLVYKLDGSSAVKNFNFNACYSTSSGNSALVTTNLGSYSNDSTLIYISNISVRNSYIATTRNITLTETASDSGLYTQSAGASGIVSTGNTCENLTISNCLYDGHTCERAIGSSSESGVTAGMIGGIISGGHNMNNVTVNGSVSLGAPVVDEVYVSGKEIFYNRYDKNQGFQVYFYGCYSDVTQQITTAYPDSYDKLEDIVRVEEKDAYEKFDMPALAWGTNWSLVTIGSRTIPMPVLNSSDVVVGSYVNAIGSDYKKYNGSGPYVDGSNPYTYNLKGSGTEADPYIIETDLQLARAIATGGMNLYDRLYYRLGNDIDISGGTWINQTEIHVGETQYTYTPFGGSLDGNGHVVTGLSIGDTVAAGLIPVLASGGEVKNLHIRDASVISSSYAGAIVGEQQSNSTVTGCSVENSIVESKEFGYHIIGSVGGSYNTLYFITADGKSLYVDENANLYGDYADGLTAVSELPFTTDADGQPIWYQGGAEDSVPRLVNNAKAMEEIDVIGDGLVDEYGTNDLVSIRNYLLNEDGFDKIYGDVNRDGKTNISDLVILRRHIADDYDNIKDSFWRNVEKNKVEIYYGENDNYDAARKVELYLESAFPGIDVIKCVSASAGTVSGTSSDSTKVYLHSSDEAKTPDGKLEIIVGNIDNYDAYTTNTIATADNTYAVSYDKANQVVWLQGANFTAVEQAVLDFIAGSDTKLYTEDGVGTCEGTLSAEKQPITVQLDTNYDGTVDTATTMYYAWGDEFEEDTLNTNNWTHNNQQTEGSNGSASSYNNLEIAPVKDLGKLITVTDGRLSMKRGHDDALGGDVSWNNEDGEPVVGSVSLDVTPGEENGYNQWTDDANGANSIDADGSDQYFSSGKIITDRGMLFKQGYIEFQGQLPADGHAFPAWWLMGRPSQSQNNQGYDNSLYGKVYKLNSNWNGATTYVANNLDTYKYQIPSAIYEIDMIEVMQHVDRHLTKKETSWLSNGSYHSIAYKTRKTGTYLYYMNSTIHKWWSNGAYGTDSLYIQDWDNYKVSSAISNSDFSTTSTDGSWIHNIGSTEYDFGTATADKKILGEYQYTYWNTESYQETAHNNLTATRKYGFSWNTNGTGFEATLYIYNTDGSLMTTVPIASGMSDYAAFKDGDKTVETSGIIGTTDSGAFKDVYSDVKVFNQYMYILFDNKYYSSNDNIDISSDASANMFTDLLTSTGLKSFEIDYVRVYQEDGCRDIVTQETENFNNNNHFGY